MSTHSKVIVQTDRQTHTHTHTDTDRYTDTTKTLLLPHTREVINTISNSERKIYQTVSGIKQVLLSLKSFPCTHNTIYEMQEKS